MKYEIFGSYFEIFVTQYFAFLKIHAFILEIKKFSKKKTENFKKFDISLENL